MRAMLMTAMFSNLLAVGQEMNVAVCSLGGVNELVLSPAKSETDLVYRSAGVQIVWHDCDEFSAAASIGNAPWFLVRLRNDKPPRTVGSASLDVMGKAFVEDRGGYMADAYFQAIDGNAQLQAGTAAVR